MLSGKMVTGREPKSSKRRLHVRHPRPTNPLRGVRPGQRWRSPNGSRAMWITTTAAQANATASNSSTSELPWASGSCVAMPRRMLVRRPRLPYPRTADRPDSDTKGEEGVDVVLDLISDAGDAHHPADTVVDHAQIHEEADKEERDSAEHELTALAEHQDSDQHREQGDKLSPGDPRRTGDRETKGQAKKGIAYEAEEGAERSGLRRGARRNREVPAEISPADDRKRQPNPPVGQPSALPAGRLAIGQDDVAKCDKVDEDDQRPLLGHKRHREHDTTTRRAPRADPSDTSGRKGPSRTG